MSHAFAAASPPVPREVSMSIRSGEPPARAWRRHLGLSVEELAASASMRVDEYERLEVSSRLRDVEAWTLASALGIWVKQLDGQRRA